MPTRWRSISARSISPASCDDDAAARGSARARRSLLPKPTPCHPRLHHQSTAANQTAPRRREHAHAQVSYYPELLARLPAGVERDALARETKAIQRRREVVDGAGLLRIALARGPGGLSLRGIAPRA
jgi:hypothetical protein